MDCKKIRTLNTGSFFEKYPMDLTEPDLGSRFFSVKKEVPTFKGIFYVTPQKIQEELQSFARGIDKKMKRTRKNVGWISVKVEKEKGKMAKCALPCDLYWHAGPGRDEKPFDRKECSTWIATSLLVFEENTTFAPLWAICKGLESTRQRVRSKSHKYYREPVGDRCWPQLLQREWINRHLAQLPSQDEFDKEQQKTRDEEAARFAKEKAEREAELQNMHLEKNQSTVQHYNKTVLLVNFHKGETGWAMETEEVQGADVFYFLSRSRAAIVVLPDGRELVKARENVRLR